MPVEGQEIAVAILAAKAELAAAKAEVLRAAAAKDEEWVRAAQKRLDAAANSWELSWAKLWFAYGKQLLRKARTRIAAVPSLGAYQAEDLVQEFLSVKVAGKLEVMFGVVARGEKPLWPRLSRSIRFFCNDVARGTNRLDLSLTPMIETGFDPFDERDPDDGASRAAKQAKARRDTCNALQEAESHLDALRRALPVGDGVPYLHVVLLKARLVLLVKIGGNHLLADEYGKTLPAGFSPRNEVERLYPWTESENARPLPAKKHPLRDVWDGLAGQVIASEFSSPTRKSIADALGMPDNTLTQILLRARRRARSEMERLLGTARAEELLADWFC